MERTDAQRVFHVLTAAFPSTPVEDGTAELYVQALADSVPDAAVAFAVAADWITGRVFFPKVAELLDEISIESERRRKRAAAIARGAEHKSDRGACPECKGGTWEWHTASESNPVPNGPPVVYEYVLPCRVCQPIKHVYWRDGHNKIGHDFEACDFATCVDKTKNGDKKRSGRVGGEPRPVDPTAARYDRDQAGVGPGF